MATRSLTKVFDQNTEVFTLYRHWDGYPACHGMELATFLDGMTIGNGKGRDGNSKYCNGIGCFSEKLVSFFKKVEDSGDFYLYPAGTNNIGEEYTYNIIVNDNNQIGVNVVSYGMGIFSGTIVEFKEFCEKHLTQ